MGIRLKGGGEEAVQGVGVVDGVGNCEFEVTEWVHHAPSPLLDSSSVNSSGTGTGEAGMCSTFSGSGSTGSIAYADSI